MTTAADTAVERGAPTPRERSVLLTVLYSDLFDYPLTADEVARYRVALDGDDSDDDPGDAPADGSVATTIEELSGARLSRVDGYVCWRGREDVVDLRRRRRAANAPRWRLARRYARWLARAPFLRMVAVCGSQAMDNAGEDGDVDVFCVTAPGRLWIAQAGAMVLRRLIPRSARICPNYFLSLDALGVAERNLFTAHEVAQTVPLWGAEAYDRFLAANRWIHDFMPDLDLADRRRFLGEEPRRPWLEKLLGGRLGDALDRAIHRLLLAYYAVRWRRHGLGRGDLERVYRRDRQGVVAGGYGPAVAEHFRRRVRQELDGAVPESDLRRLFPPSENGRAAEPFDELFVRHYGTVS